MKKNCSLCMRLSNIPSFLFVVFILSQMLPSLGLALTEPFNAWGKIALLLYPLGLYMILYSLSKNIGLIHLLLTPLIILHAFQIVVFSIFKEEIIAPDMFLNVVTTSVNEAGEVLNGQISAVIFVIVVYLPLIVMAIRAIRCQVYQKKLFRRRSFFSGVLILFVVYLISFSAKNRNTDNFCYAEDLYPTNLLYNLDFAVDLWNYSKNYQASSEGFSFLAQRMLPQTNKREIYVLVIGETGRADNWSLYGYPKPTTPLLVKDGSWIHYTDAITQSNTTHKSVPIIMSAASAEKFEVLYQQKSILTAFKEAGYYTVFLSNQVANRTYTDFFAQEADTCQYFRFFDTKDNLFDEVLVDKMEHFIESTQQNLFIVLHTYGSHFNYTERYPSNFAQFTPDKFPSINKKYKEEMVNAYDNTILYTDYVLHRTAALLAKQESYSALLYCTDHGEDLLDDSREKFLHASPSPTYYQLKIPFLLWFSSEYQRAFPEKVAAAQANGHKAISTQNVFHTVLDMAFIDSNQSFKHLSLVSEQFKESTRMYLNERYKPIPYQKANLKELDIVQLKKQKMKPY